MKPGVISEKNLEKDLICKCGTPARKMPRCGKRRYRHKCPHGKWCAHGDRLLGVHANHNNLCGICRAHATALRLNADPNFTHKSEIYRGIKERADQRDRRSD